MKRILALLAAVTVLLTLAACGGGGNEFPLALPDLDYEVCFVAEQVGGLTTIIGTTEMGKTQSILSIPKTIGGATVQAIAAGAFEGCTSLKSIVIPEDCGIAYLNNGAFSGASALKHIVILKKHDAITVSANLLDGAASGAKVYVLPEYYSDYVSYYTWGAFSSKIAKYE